MPGIVVIVPCLNEAELLPATLEALRTAFDTANADARIILVDGGSDDNSVEIAKSQGCHVIDSDRRQRAHQLNLGARASGADHDVLWFVHADTRVPSGSVMQLRRSMDDQRILGGGFCRRFDSNSLTLFLGSLVADLRGSFWNYFYGDQAMFVRKSAFEKLGGFDESLDIAEDLDLSLRLRQSGKVVALRPPVIGSARRFEAQGAWRQMSRDRAYVKAWMADRGWHDWRRRQDA